MSNPIALITGAGSGIGRACAVALSRAGWTLVLTGRHGRTLDATARLLSGPAIMHAADISRAQEVRATPSFFPKGRTACAGVRCCSVAGSVHRAPQVSLSR